VLFYAIFPRHTKRAPPSGGGRPPPQRRPTYREAAGTQVVGFRSRQIQRKLDGKKKESGHGKNRKEEGKFGTSAHYSNAGEKREDFLLLGVPPNRTPPHKRKPAPRLRQQGSASTMWSSGHSSRGTPLTFPWGCPLVPKKEGTAQRMVQVGRMVPEKSSCIRFYGRKKKKRNSRSRDLNMDADEKRPKGRGRASEPSSIASPPLLTSVSTDSKRIVVGGFSLWGRRDREWARVVVR